MSISLPHRIVLYVRRPGTLKWSDSIIAYVVSVEYFVGSMPHIDYSYTGQGKQHLTPEESISKLTFDCGEYRAYEKLNSMTGCEELEFKAVTQHTLTCFIGHIQRIYTARTPNCWRVEIDYVDDIAVLHLYTFEINTPLDEQKHYRHVQFLGAS